MLQAKGACPYWALPKGPPQRRHALREGNVGVGQRKQVQKRRIRLFQAYFYDGVANGPEAGDGLGLASPVSMPPFNQPFKHITARRGPGGIGQPMPVVQHILGSERPFGPLVISYAPPQVKPIDPSPIQHVVAGRQPRDELQTVIIPHQPLKQLLSKPHADEVPRVERV
jgi:hypothetical protein